MTLLTSTVHFDDDNPGDMIVALRRYRMLSRIGAETVIKPDTDYVKVDVK